MQFMSILSCFWWLGYIKGVIHIIGNGDSRYVTIMPISCFSHFCEYKRGDKPYAQSKSNMLWYRILRAYHFINVSIHVSESIWRWSYCLNEVDLCHDVTASSTIWNIILVIQATGLGHDINPLDYSLFALSRSSIHSKSMELVCLDVHHQLVRPREDR